jgi:hypothetical protein
VRCHLLVPAVTRWCRWHDGEVSAEHTVVIAVEEAATGPGWLICACLACVHFYGLKPLTDQEPEQAAGPAFIGRRAAPPISTRGLT